MKHPHILSLLALMLVFSLAAGACGLRPNVTEPSPAEVNAAPTPDTVSPEPTEMPATAEPASSVSEPSPAPTADSFPAGPFNPLTGEPADEDCSRLRPVAVMVENNHAAGMIAQAGISRADILIEFQTEQITRNMALFMNIGDVPAIYPVRSARSYFASAAMAFDAIFVHAGRSDNGVENSSSVLQYFTDHDDIDLRDSDYIYRMEVWPHIGEHGLATSGQLLTDAFTALGTRREHKSDAFDNGLRFSENAVPTDGEPAGSIRIVFPGSKTMDLRYDAQRKGYTGYQWDAPYVDDNNGEAVVFQNVLVIAAPTKVGADEYYSSVITTTDVNGEGYFFNGGYAEKITWSRGSLDTPFRFFGADGAELALGVGHSYIAFVSPDIGGASFS
ncbi:MAG: DUF3048 domain-containing protein [Oscillospiraceae bacterium]|nr:DUF3048 domain-containing protein [Oscillospiraceae bacterium]